MLFSVCTPSMREFFLGKNMDKEKFKIAETFMNRRSFEIEAGRSVIANGPKDLTKDVGLRTTLLDSSLTTYRAMMYALGTPITSISDNVRAIRDARRSRNGVAEFAQNVFNTWDTLVQNSQPRELTPMQEVVITQLHEDPLT